MILKGTKILITGAGGFIGSHLTETLAKMGATVRALVHYNSRNDWGMIEELPEDVRQELDVVPGDIRDPIFIKTAVKDCEIVFHLASLIGIPYSYHAPVSYVETNVVGTLNVMQACLEQGVHKAVHTSTSEVYGTAQYTPIDEEHPLQGQSPYSASKIGADKIVESYHLSYDLPVTTIRPFNTFGPRQSARAVIPAIISQALGGGEIELGLLEPVRDFTYVTDMVDAFVRIAESDDDVGKTINIGSGNGVSIGDLATKILEVMGVEKKIFENPERLRPPHSEVMNLVCDNQKAKKFLGWETHTSLEQGLKETIEYYRANLHKYKPWLYNI